MRAACATLLIALYPLAGQQPAPRQQVPEQGVENPLRGDPQAIEAGRSQYLTSCAGCHGPTAEGGRGPKLANRGGRGWRDDRLFDSIKNGIKGSDMPPSPLPDEKIWQLAAYVRNLNSPAVEGRVPGDEQAGRAVFFGNGGCSQCHRIRGQGGMLGPDLSNIGGSRTLAQIRESILKPSLRPTEGFDGVTVRMKSGATVQGIAKDNTNYTIQVMDAKGELHFISKTDVTQVLFRKKSLMPEDAGSRLSRDDLRNLLAFLSRQAIRTDRLEN